MERQHRSTHDARSGAYDGQDLVAQGRHARLVGGLDVESQQRFGVGRTQIEPGSPLKRDGESVELVEDGTLAPRECLTDRRRTPRGIATSELISPEAT